MEDHRTHGSHNESQKDEGTLRSHDRSSYERVETIQHSEGVADPCTLQGRHRDKDGDEEGECPVAARAQSASGEYLEDETTAGIHELCRHGAAGLPTQ